MYDYYDDDDDGWSALPSNLRQVLAHDGPICSQQSWPADHHHHYDDYDEDYDDTGHEK